jgi:hypothetical protein
MGEERKDYKVMMGKPEGKRPLGRPRRRWEVGSEWILGRLAWGVWIGFDWLRTGTSCCECGDKPSGSCAKELVMVCIQLFNDTVTFFGLIFPPSDYIT